ncbi:hypothetical protein AAC387_Pa05g2767 [Persea americana]
MLPNTNAYFFNPPPNQIQQLNLSYYFSSLCICPPRSPILFTDKPFRLCERLPSTGILRALARLRLSAFPATASSGTGD